MLSSVSVSNFKRIGQLPLVLNGLTKINYLVGEKNSGKSSFLYRLFVEGVSSLELKVGNFEAVNKNERFSENNPDLSVLNESKTDRSTNLKLNLQNDLEKIADMKLWELVEKNELQYSKVEIVPSKKFIAGYASYNGHVLLKIVEELNQSCDGEDSILSGKHLQKPEIAKQIFWYLAKNYGYFELSLVRYFAGKFVDGRVSGEPLWGSFISQGKIWTTNSNYDNRKKSEILFQAGGQNHISSLRWVLDIIESGVELGYQINCLILEQPEADLHPDWQKEIPLILQEYACRDNLQFFVATHSPFIITSAGEITEKEREENSIAKQSFIPSQKVYLIKEGQTASKSGEIGVAKNGFVLGSDGYWGRKIGFVAAKMLGMGLSEFVDDTKIQASIDAPILIFCEGEGMQEDADIYNTIFWNHHPRVLFVSSKGSSQTAWSFDILEQIKKGLYANFKLLMLRDRDHEFPSFEDIQKYKLQYPQRRVLYRRAIECYLYSSETAELWLKQYGLDLPEKIRIRLDNLHKEISFGVQHGVVGDAYKEKLETAFEEVYKFRQKRMSKYKYGKIPAVSPMAKKLEIARLIVKKTESYQELLEAIFGK
jgi:hypothetical protein